MATSAEETRRWFYVREGQRHGPVETARLVDLVLGGDVPEDCLVWHSGLTEWRPAREVEEIRRELPPPLPTSPVTPPPQPLPRETSEAAAPQAPSVETSAAGEIRDAPAELPDLEEPEGQKRRRKRKHRHRNAKKRPPWLWPLAVVLVVLMVFLWWLLRRMNEVPPGRIIQTGSARVSPWPGRAALPGSASVSRLVSIPGSAPAIASAPHA